MRIFICLVVASLSIGPAAAGFQSSTPSGPSISDYWINNGNGDMNNATIMGGIYFDSASIEYDIFKDVWMGNVTYTTKWKRNIAVTDACVGIQKYTVYAQDERSHELHAINKYTGNDRWTLKLKENYNRIQFVQGKYAVLMNRYGFIQVDLYKKFIVTGKSYDIDIVSGGYYCLIKSKKNDNYYVSVLSNQTWRFFKLKNT